MADADERVTGFNLARLKVEGTIQDFSTGATLAPGDEGYDEAKAACDASARAYGEELERRGEIGGFELHGAARTNQSGIVPTRFVVLVEPDEEPEFTSGGLMLPRQYRDPRNAAAVTGRVIDIADEAFSFIADPTTRRPQVGDRIAFTKYAGMAIHGADKKLYKLMNDEDISGILEFAAPTHLN